MAANSDSLSLPPVPAPAPATFPNRDRVVSQALRAYAKHRGVSKQAVHQKFGKGEPRTRRRLR